MITPRYLYPELERVPVNGVRHYATPSGQLVPSVTTILSATADAEASEALENWRNAVGHKRAAEVTTEAGNRGTRMHAYLEHWVKTGELKVPGSNPYAKQSNKMAQIIIEQGLQHATEFWGSETALYFHGLYAGTTDLVGCWRGKPAIMDFKQSNKPKTTERVEGYFYQLAAYANAHNEMFGTDIRTGVILMCSKDYEYQQWVIEGDEFDHWSNLWWHKLEHYYLLNT